MSDRLRILVVDDDDLQRTYAQGVLGIAGYEVVTSENGAEALRLVEHQLEAVRLLIDGSLNQPPAVA